MTAPEAQDDYERGGPAQSGWRREGGRSCRKGNQEKTRRESQPILPREKSQRAAGQRAMRKIKAQTASGYSGLQEDQEDEYNVSTGDAVLCLQTPTSSSDEQIVQPFLVACNRFFGAGSSSGESDVDDEEVCSPPRPVGVAFDFGGELQAGCLN